MNNTVEYLLQWAQRLRTAGEIRRMVETAERKNPWFVPKFVQHSLDAITNEMLNEQKLRQWLSAYERREVGKTVGLILAGNLPLVGFHDFLCAYVAGCRMQIKMSSKDNELFPALFRLLADIDTGLNERVTFVDTLKDFDAVIATGSDNTNRYFEYYFRQYPKILRRNRNSVAILTGNESESALRALADDIFLYFGFGCRNVSGLLVPQGYDVRILFPQFATYAWMHEHNKYMNNYDYQRTLLMLNKVPHLANEFVMLVENPSIPSPIATLHYRYYTDENEVRQILSDQTEKIQCVVSNQPENWNTPSSVPFGKSQHPELWDYADGVDTMKLLLCL